MEGEVEDRDEVVPEVWNIEDIGELHLLQSLSIEDRLKEDTAFAPGEDRGSISKLDLHPVGDKVPDPVKVRGHMA